MRRVLAIALITAVLGCAYRYRFETGLTPSDRKVSRWLHFAAWGLEPGEPFDLEAACPEGVAEFGSYVSVANWLPALLTVGFYAPRTAYAICAATDGR